MKIPGKGKIETTPRPLDLPLPLFFKETLRKKVKIQAMTVVRQATSVLLYYKDIVNNFYNEKIIDDYGSWDDSDNSSTEDGDDKVLSPDSEEMDGSSSASDGGATAAVAAEKNFPSDSSVASEEDGSSSASDESSSSSSSSPAEEKMTGASDVLPTENKLERNVHGSITNKLATTCQELPTIIPVLNLSEQIYPLVPNDEVFNSMSSINICVDGKHNQSISSLKISCRSFQNFIIIFSYTKEGKQIHTQTKNTIIQATKGRDWRKLRENCHYCVYRYGGKPWDKTNQSNYKEKEIRNVLISYLYEKMKRC